MGQKRKKEKKNYLKAGRVNIKIVKLVVGLETSLEKSLILNSAHD